MEEDEEEEEELTQNILSNINFWAHVWQKKIERNSTKELIRSYVMRVT